MASRDGRVYTNLSIGSSPYADVKTTTNVPVVIVPLVVTVNGVTLDPTAALTNSCVRPDWNGKTPVQVLLESPIFTATDWTMNGQHIGNGQYLDAFQRAQYWSLVQGSDYHTVLNPTVADAQTVPASAIDPSATTATSACVAQSGGAPDQIILGASDTGLLTPWLEGTLIPQLRAQGVINSGELVYFLLYNATLSDTTGFHSYVGTQTYAASLINGSDCCSADIKTISHVVAEWMNDPFPAEAQNQTPGWTAPADNPVSAAGCQSNSAVGNPTAASMFPDVAMPNGLTYHPQELAFYSWFHGAPSMGAAGLYSNNSTLAVDAGAVCHAVVSALTITTASLPTAGLNAPYSVTLSATGGTGPYTWGLAAGRLPPGLTLDPITGTISGSPPYLFFDYLLTFRVTDTSSPAQTATASFSLSISTIVTSPLSGGTVGVPYSQTLTATGGASPYTWQLVGGTLPTGLSFNSSLGSIGGTPVVPAIATPLTFKVTDSSAPQQSLTTILPLTIAPAPLTVPTTSLPNGLVGQPYTQTLTAAGGTLPYAWQLLVGTLPAGMTLNAATGVISGVPLAPVTATQLVFRVTDSGTPPQIANSTTLLLTTIGSQSQVTVTTTAIPNGLVGAPYSATLSAIGGTSPYTWQLLSGTLPPGLTLNPRTGAIGGTPTAPVTATPLVFLATDSGTPQRSASSSTLLLTIAANMTTVTTASLPSGAVGSSYSFTLTAAGGVPPYLWSLISGTLPNGLSLTPAGVISGTPAATVTATPLVFRVTDSATPQQTATSVTLTLTIAAAPPTILTTALPNGALGSLYSLTLTATGGTLPYNWQVTTGTLPSGLSLNPATGSISGTPTVSGTVTPLTFKVTDASTPPQTATANLTLTIASTPLQITTGSLIPGTIGLYYSQMVTVTGGTAPYQWSLVGGRMPPGLTLNTATGEISGIPGDPAGSLMTIQVTDSSTPQQTVVRKVGIDFFWGWP